MMAYAASAYRATRSAVAVLTSKVAECQGPSLGFDREFDLHVGDRDRDRSVQGSPPLECLDERRGA